MWQGPDPAGAAGDQQADHGEEGEGEAEARAGAEEGARGGGRARAGRWLEVLTDFCETCESSLTAYLGSNIQRFSYVHLPGAAGDVVPDPGCAELHLRLGVECPGECLV